MIKLGTIVKDSATDLAGMLTIFEERIGGNSFYLLQPRGLNPKDGQPAKRLWLDPPRVIGGVAAELPTDWPREILGTEVEDEASGFKGKAIAIALHISGCVHVSVQPAGVTETGAAIESEQFDLRRLSGPAIKKLTEPERAKSQKDKPSPGELVSFR